ncbi:MAG: hypothetical protein FJ137_19280 [Deltaproteobacteria bacterium]|nr:hypothetical protein [Deltaproteobacteria bacterium]
MDAELALGVGLVAGVRHAADPDHILVVSQLTRPGTSALTASKTALSWGLGHSVTIMAMGMVLVLTGSSLPDGAAVVAQLAGAVMLVALAWRPPQAASVPQVERRAAMVGLVHGAAGAGGAAVLALSATTSLSVAMLSLALMCLGTMAAMVALTCGFIVGSAHVSPPLLDGAVRLSRLLAVVLAAALAWSALSSLFT